MNKMELHDVLRKVLAQDEPDVLRELMKVFLEALMGAEADSVCGAAWGERSDERVNSRNGYRDRDFDSRVGTIALDMPKLRKGLLLPRLAAGALAARRACADRGDRRVLRQGRVDQKGRWDRQGTRDRGNLEFPGLTHGQVSGYGSRVLSLPPA